MLQVSIKKASTGEHLDHGNFNSEAEAMIWFQPFIDSGVYGKSAYSYEQLISEEVPAVLDEEGNELSPSIPAQYETIHVPAEYTVEIEDISESLSAQKESAEALAFLSSTDYKILKHLREKTLGLTPTLSDEELEELELLRHEAALKVI